MTPTPVHPERVLGFWAVTKGRLTVLQLGGLARKQQLTAHPVTLMDLREVFFSGENEVTLCKTQVSGGVYTAELHPQREGLAARKEHGRNTALSSEFGAIMRSCWWTSGFTDHGQHPGVRQHERRRFWWTSRSFTQVNIHAAARLSPASEQSKASCWIVSTPPPPSAYIKCLQFTIYKDRVGI